jgi:Domain of unknown function (DUF4360)
MLLPIPYAVHLQQLLTASSLLATPSLRIAPPDINISSAPPETAIRSVVIAGSGCFSNSGSFSNPSPNIFAFTSPNLTAAIGSDSFIVDMRKFCQMAVDVRYPQGWQFAVQRSEVIGAVDLGKGVNATQAGLVYFSGDASQVNPLFSHFRTREMLTLFRHRRHSTRILMAKYLDPSSSATRRAMMVPQCGHRAATRERSMSWLVRLLRGQEDPGEEGRGV